MHSLQGNENIVAIDGAKSPVEGLSGESGIPRNESRQPKLGFGASVSYRRRK
jgi:hypothetical protein